MKDKKNLLYAVLASLFIIGLVTTLSWSYTSRWFGLFLLLVSMIGLYGISNRGQNNTEHNQLSLERSFLGLLLILIDIAYNLIMKDGFRYFDYGIISAGLIIILLNINCLKFLRLDEQKISFSTYFLFLTVLLYGFLFEGIDILLKSTGTPSNPFWDWFSINVVSMAIPILNLIKPTVSDAALINFDNFTVSVGYACSGVESISVFFSAVIAYFISVKEYDLIRIIKYLLIGGILLYTVNLIRIIIIIITGYYYGVSTMMFVHAHLGWIFFVLSMTVFWYLVFNEKLRH